MKEECEKCKNEGWTACCLCTETLEEYKTRVLKWLAVNNLFPVKTRVYKTRRYGKEVRVYCPPMSYTSNRNSRRMIKNPTDGYNSTFGKHHITIPMYIHINEEDLKSDDEKKFILDMIKESAYLKA